MTYCVAIRVNDGIILASDSRTNAGVDQVSTYSKMHELLADGERSITILSAGNLATSQAVVRRLHKDVEADSKINLKSVPTLADAADYLAQLGHAELRKHVQTNKKGFSPEASFILAGQIKGQSHQIYLIYPEGNYIRAPRRTPFLQIGELKYGKPILDRIVEPELDLETAARCALVSMDSTMRSNLGVGPPVELLIFKADKLAKAERYLLDADDEYLRELRAAWQQQMKEAFAKLPHLPSRESPMRLVDGHNDL